MDKKSLIILPTYSNYLDVCFCFLELLEKKWENHPKVILSIIGDNKSIKNYDFIYNEKGTSLPKAIYNATKKYKADYYFCLLGDAFITENINQQFVERLLSIMTEKKINYCSLLPVKSSLQPKKNRDIFNYIKYQDRYSHNFIAFIASEKFIQEEFSNNITDFEFELKYLKIANEMLKGYFDDRIILNRNYMNINHGISKGKWIRKTYKMLLKQNLDKPLPNRRIMSIKETLLLNVGLLINWIFPNKIRILLKKFLSKYLFMKFPTKY